MTRSIVNRLGIILALAGAMGAVACSGTDELTTAEVSQPLSASDHFYLRCNTTGWYVDDATRLVPVTADGQLRELEFEVTQPWMVTNGDSCIVTATNQLNGWGTQTTEFGIMSSPLVVPGGTQLVTWGGHFRIQFPELGTYRAQLNAANGSFSVGAADDIEPELTHRAICVIADFQDQKLEDFQGTGVTSEAEIEPLLDGMEDHWEWLSHGTERIGWDLIRIELPKQLNLDVDCTSNADCPADYTCHTGEQKCRAYAGWVEYRNDVAQLTRARLIELGLDPADYDVDADGDLDAVWAIASNGGRTDDFMLGGASLNAGAHVFVDWQDSLSITGGHIGNFNHELGHLRGLPDLYGEYSTLHTLTLMAHSWFLPPPDFSAYERTVLGWVEPVVVSENTNDIVLESANDEFAAVKIPTGFEGEYFLIEYRVVPSEGYGSESLPYDGLAVYHVLEGSHQGQNPPLLALVPADGQITPQSTPELTDFLSPSNGSLTLPFSAYSYYGGQEAFRITELVQESGAMRFSVEVFSPSASASAVPNGSFEAATDGSPDGWEQTGWNAYAATFDLDTTQATEGTQSATIYSATTDVDARFEQTISVTNGGSYTLCGQIRAADIQPGPDGASTGGNLTVEWTRSDGSIGWHTTNAGLGSYDWGEHCMTFQPEADEVRVQCRLGHYASTVTGQVWCDDLTLIELVTQL